MTDQSDRLPCGGRLDRSRRIPFTFDGRAYVGYSGDTLASALLANRVHLIGRSFKYHRPRGVFTCGPEEPSALVTLGESGYIEPNVPATTAELWPGLVARSQNRWPSLAFDLLAVNSLLKPLLPPGFYYKTFMWPRSFWYWIYEPAIRRAAGLGTIGNEPDPDRYEHAHTHCDVLIVGAGPAGLMAADAASRSGAQVLLVDDKGAPGGCLLGESCDIDGRSAADWAAGLYDELVARDTVRVLSRTTVFGQYDGLTFGAVERVTDHLGPGHDHLPRQRLWTIETKHLVCATGAIERSLVFDNNDRPGVMLASAVRTYINRFAVLPGRKAVLFTNNDDAYRTARDLVVAGASVIVVDSRPKDHVTGTSLLQGNIEVRFEHCIVETRGRRHVRAVKIAPLSRVSGLREDVLACDLLCISGGWNPTVHLLSHTGRRPSWNTEISSHIMTAHDGNTQVAGGAAGTFDLDTILRAGQAAGRAASLACRFAAGGATEVPAVDTLPPYRIEPLWRSPRWLSRGGASFVDLQNDVTVADIEFAAHEGFRHAEHAKRYTTLGMATDQGKLSNVNALGILAELRETPVAEVEPTSFRPLYVSAALGTLAGPVRGKEFRPVRRSPVDAWHERHGAVFTDAGLWRRPYYYPRAGESFSVAVEREVQTVRTGVGIADVSTLGKVELKGPDAGKFLDRLYINTLSKVTIGRTRYAVMLREDGMVFDDGTVSRLAENHYFITLTTANAGPVMQHIDFCHQVHWPELDVQFCSVTEAWAGMAIAGPKSREVLTRAVAGIDLSRQTFPPLSVADGTVRAIPVRVLRISYSGELAFEVYAPAGAGMEVWQAIIIAGEDESIAPYGTEAMTVLRTEKGHVAGPEITGRTTADDLGLGRLISKNKDCVGRWLATREGLRGTGREQLVGLKPLRQHDRLRTGAHLVVDPGEVGPSTSHGHITTAGYSPTCGHFIGLALLKDGRKRLHERIYAVSPLHGEQVEVEVTSPVFVDSEGERMHA